jgi:GTPase
VSARSGEGVEELQQAIAAAIPAPELELTLLVPYDRGEVISRLHLTGRVKSTEYLEEGTRVLAMVHPRNLGDVQPFVI